MYVVQNFDHPVHLLVNSERQRETVDSTAAESVSIHGDENGKKQEKTADACILQRNSGRSCDIWRMVL